MPGSLPPDTQARSLRPCWNASLRAELEVAEPVLRYSIHGTFTGCCASALAAQLANNKPRRTTPLHFRFWVFDFQLGPDREPMRICFFDSFSLRSKIQT